MSFKKELEQLLNKHSKENGSNTPDFILVTYLGECLEVFNRAIIHRENWYGRFVDHDGPGPTNSKEIKNELHRDSNQSSTTSGTKI